MKIALNEADGTIAIAELGVLYQTVASSARSSGTSSRKCFPVRLIWIC